MLIIVLIHRCRPEHARALVFAAAIVSQGGGGGGGSGITSSRGGTGCAFAVGIVEKVVAVHPGIGVIMRGRPLLG